MQLNRKKTTEGRRSFLKKSLTAAGTATMGGALLGTSVKAFAEESSGSLRKGDAAILRFLAAAEIIESDLWLQYAELGGTQLSDLPGLPTGGSAIYMAKLELLDSDLPQYIHDNADDEISHFMFINAYLASKGADTVDLSHFATIPSSKATGANQIGRLTNLMELTVDTSWYTRYRDGDHNPDLDPSFTFEQAVKGLAKGKHPAIPRSDNDLSPSDHIQAIANTAGFHFGFIEQGGSSLYPSLAQRVTDPEVLRILLSIGPTETAHFQTWHDKAGNAVSDPLAPLTDPNDATLVFPNLNVNPGGEEFQTNLIMPEPCPFLSRMFPVCSIIRPTATKGAAMGAVKALTADGLFNGQTNKEFFELLRDLAEDADEAQRECV
ncbi:MAG: hypothetical protein JOY54_02300 [Acidobacteriaceae bacterium]|nr:hypothetical protein [Acidobacteriaceae bacterium]